MKRGSKLLYDIVSKCSKYVINGSAKVDFAKRYAHEHKLSTLVLKGSDDTYLGCITLSQMNTVEDLEKPVSDFADHSFETLEKLDTERELRGLTPLVVGGKLEGIVILPTQAQLTRLSSSMNTVAIVGMGFVGATLAIALAECGLKVIGVEKSKEIREILTKGNLHFYEPNGDDRLGAVINDNRLSIVSPQEKITADAFVVTVGTPLNSKTDKTPNKQYLKDAFKYVKKNTKGGEVVIFRSTVPVGTCDSIIAENQKFFISDDEESNLNIVMAPERTIEGKALKELFNNPQIMGAKSSIGMAKAEKIFSFLGVSVFKFSSFKEAELAKLVDNTYRDFWFSYSNMLALLANDFEIDVLKVIEAVNTGYDRTNVAKPSPGVGGPCLSKDPYIFLDGIQHKSPIIEKLIFASREVNSYILKQFIASFLESVENKNHVVHVLGIAFKGDPETDDLRDSTSLDAISQLRLAGQKYKVWDPVIESSKLLPFGETVLESDIGKDAVGIIILNNHKCFSQFNWEKIANRMKKTVLYDGWNVLNDAQKGHFEISQTLGKYK